MRAHVIGPHVGDHVDIIHPRRACEFFDAGFIRSPATGLTMRFNRLFFWFFYRLGTPPWEGHPLPRRLNELVEGPSALPPGKALDVDAAPATPRSISRSTVGMSPRSIS